MDVFALTRALVDTESITGNEEPMARLVLETLRPLAERYGGTLETMTVEPRRDNVLACFGAPIVTLSTHLDTVPPFFPSREDDEFIHGRGSCDVKGIIAAMICAAEKVLAEGVRNFALLFVVGEERNSAGAYHAAKHPRGSRYLINGEPTSNRLAVGSKGALRLEVTASGRMAHSAYPELGESAIEKLLDAIARIRAVKLLDDPLLGDSTLNIGTLSGGRAPNVVADQAKAELLIRLVDDGLSTIEMLQQAAGPAVTAEAVLRIPAVRLGTLPGFDTMVAKYTTDIPAFGGAWGEPFLIGPGTIHVAHTSEERVPKRELLEAIELYASMIRQLIARH